SCIKVVGIPAHLQYCYPVGLERSGGKGTCEDTAGEKLILAEPVRLNHQRISFAGTKSGRLYQSRFPFVTGVILPVDHFSLSQFDILQLWIRIPDHNRSSIRFILGNEYGGLVDALALSQFDPQIGKAWILGACNLPPAVGFLVEDRGGRL